MNSSGGGSSMLAAAAAGGGMMRSLFTVHQWQELEHQALIYKYMIAGLPVPPDLVLPIQKSFESISARFFHHPGMGYCSFYGKKIDPEPGRCRRTDGKKWRCSKDAYPDSKYCERHMHRGRNRSRKPVESSQTISKSASSTVASFTSCGGGSAEVGANATLQDMHLQGFGNNPQGGASSGIIQSQYNVDQIPCGISSKDYRMAEHSFFSDDSSSNRNLQLETAWSMLPSQVSSYPSSKSGSSTMQTIYPSVYDSEFTSAEPGKSGQLLRPFFDEWPKSRDSWSCLEGDRTNQTSYSTTQLSISIPMASSGSSSQSPHDNSKLLVS